MGFGGGSGFRAVLVVGCCLGSRALGLMGFEGYSGYVGRLEF